MTLYNELEILYSNILLTNYQQILINVYVIIFSDVEQMLYI